MLIDLKNLRSKLQASMRGVKYAFLGFVLFSSFDTFAGFACIPFSYSSVDLQITPKTLSATPNNTGADVLLSQSSVRSGKSNSASECTTSSSAYLNFDVTPCANSCSYQSSSFNRSRGGGTSVDIFFISVETPVARALLYNGGSSPNPVFKIVQQVNVSCPGGELTVSIDASLGGYRVDGINRACNGAYTVTHTLSIYQTQNTPTSTPIQTFRLGAELNLGITLLDGINASPISYRAGTISGSNNVELNFVSSKCTVTAPISNVVLRDHDAYRLLIDNTGNYGSNRATNFNIRVTGCSRSSFNTVSFFWVYSDVDSGNNSILLNSNTGPNSAVNVGVQLIYLAPSTTQTIVRHRTSLPIERADLPAISSETGIITFRAKMLKSSNANSYLDIRPGAFSANATLFVEYQ